MVSPPLDRRTSVTASNCEMRPYKGSSGAESRRFRVVREESPVGPWEYMSGTGLLFSAPHHAVHFRDGVEKVAEPGTGELASALARATGGAALVAVNGQTADPSWTHDHPY